MSRMDEVVKAAKSAVMKSDKPEQWELHFVPVRNYSVELAKATGADVEVVELAAWLHDLGRAKYSTTENHHKTGAEEARKILKKLGYPEKTIKQVEGCILTHVCEKGMPQPLTIEAKIISSADAMAHYDTIPWLLSVSIKNHNGDLKASVEWVLEKVNRGWEKKILVPEGKKMVEEKYRAAKLMLESTLKLL